MTDSEAHQTLLQWKRPETIEYPKIWYTFKARDLNNDNLVEYRIQDLALDRVDDLYEHLIKNFIAHGTGWIGSRRSR